MTCVDFLGDVFVEVGEVAVEAGGGFAVFELLVVGFGVGGLLGVA